VGTGLKSFVPFKAFQNKTPQQELSKKKIIIGEELQEKLLKKSYKQNK